MEENKHCIECERYKEFNLDIDLEYDMEGSSACTHCLDEEIDYEN